VSLVSFPQLLGSGREIRSNRTAGDDDDVDDDVDSLVATSIKVTAMVMMGGLLRRSWEVARHLLFA
jgi:hypothetical protein